MIIGTFQSATGVISIEIDNGGSVIDMPITGIGELSYNFDVTPEAVTIDRMLALYSGLRVDFGEFNELGANIYDTLYDALLNAPDRELPATLKIKTHDLIEYEFPFTVDIGDVSFDEGAHSGSFTCKALAKDATFEDVFNEIPAAEKKEYKITSEAPPSIVRDRDVIVRGEGLDIPATGVKSWINSALNEVFGNEYDNDIRISSSELSDEYSPAIYDRLTNSENRILFCLLNIGEDFVTISDDKNRIAQQGTVSILSNQGQNSGGGLIDPNIQIVTNAQMFAGEGVDFLAPGVLKVGDQVHVKVEQVWVIAGTVIDIEGSGLAILNITRRAVLGQDRPWSVFRGEFANQRPALEVLKELAGIEGAIFGTGFNKNFYFNRIIDAPPDVELDYDLVNRMRPASSNLFLGNSRVTQLSTTQAVPTKFVKKKRTFWEKLFGDPARYKLEVDELPDDPYGIFPYGDSDDQIQFARYSLPIMSRQSSVVVGNPRASKELLIEIPAAYPLMSRGRYSPTAINDKIIGRYNNWESDDALESRLTSVGLRSYYRALTNEENDLKIEFELQGALTLKPWELFAFKNVPETPERYRGKTFRISQIRYNLVDDVCRVVAYQITDFDIDPVSSSPDVPVLTRSRASITLDWNGKQPVTSSVDVVAKGTSLPVELSLVNSDAGYDISIDGLNFARTLRLNPDGFGSLAQRVIVRYGGDETTPLREFVQFRRGFLEIRQGERSTDVRLRTSLTQSQRFNTVGITTEPIGDATISTLPVDMFTEVEKGNELILVGGNTGARYAVTLSDDIDTGAGTLSIEPQFMERDTYRVEVSQAATRTGITVTEREVVLKAIGNGRVAAVRLSAPADEGTLINIQAETVNVAGVVIEQLNTDLNTGTISSNYEEGVSGWRITGDGDAEFGNVIVRGSITTQEGSDIDGIYVSNINAGNINTGTIDAEIISVTNLDADNITTGTLNVSRLNVADIITTGSIIVSGSDVSELNNDSGYTDFDADDVQEAINANVTIIDGGKIITGTIDANQVNVTNLNASLIVTGSIDAGEIAVTNINATDINTGTLNAELIQAGSINASKLNVADLFAGNIVATGSIESDNYEMLSNGWKIDGDTGIAEFQAVVARGNIVTLNGSDIDGVYVSNINAGNINTGTLDADRIAADSIDASKLNVASLFAGTIFVTGDIQSDVYTIGGEGWRIRGQGDAEFNQVRVSGEIIAGSGSQIDGLYVSNLNASNINSGTIDASIINVTNLNADNITAGTIDTDRLNVTDIFTQNINVAGSIEGNYEEGVSGWRVSGDGNAEFNDALFRGNIATGNIVGDLKVVGTGSIQLEDGSLIGNEGSTVRFGGQFWDNSQDVSLTTTQLRYDSTPSGQPSLLRATYGAESMQVGNPDDGVLGRHVIIDTDSIVLKQGSSEFFKLLNVLTGANIDLDGDMNVTGGIEAGTVQSAYKSSDGSNGLTTTVSVPDGFGGSQILFFKNGILTSVASGV